MSVFGCCVKCLVIVSLLLCGYMCDQWVWIQVNSNVKYSLNWYFHDSAACKGPLIEVGSLWRRSRWRDPARRNGWGGIPRYGRTGARERGTDVRMSLRGGVLVVMGVWMWMGMLVGVVMGMRLCVSVWAGTWMQVSAREIACSRSRSWSMMSAEVLVGLSLYLSRGLGVQAGAGRQQPVGLLWVHSVQILALEPFGLCARGQRFKGHIWILDVLGFLSPVLLNASLQRPTAHDDGERDRDDTGHCDHNHVNQPLGARGTGCFISGKYHTLLLLGDQPPHTHTGNVLGPGHQPFDGHTVLSRPNIDLPHVPLSKHSVQHTKGCRVLGFRGSPVQSNCIVCVPHHLHWADHPVGVLLQRRGVGSQVAQVCLLQIQQCIWVGGGGGPRCGSVSQAETG